MVVEGFCSVIRVQCELNQRTGRELDTHWQGGYCRICGVYWMIKIIDWWCCKKLYEYMRAGGKAGMGRRVM